TAVAGTASDTPHARASRTRSCCSTCSARRSSGSRSRTSSSCTPSSRPRRSSATTRARSTSRSELLASVHADEHAELPLDCPVEEPPQQLDVLEQVRARFVLSGIPVPDLGIDPPRAHVLRIEARQELLVTEGAEGVAHG